MAKWVYMFTEGNADMRNLLGGKGANLAEMTNLGLPVPQGFTVTTEACHFCKVRTFSTKQVSHGCVTFGKHINPFCHV